MIFGLPLTHAYAALWQSVAENLTFWDNILHFTYRFFYYFKFHSHIALVPQIIPSMTTLSTFPANQKVSNTKKCFPGKLLLGEQHKNSTIRHLSSTLRFFYFGANRLLPHAQIFCGACGLGWGLCNYRRPSGKSDTNFSHL